MNRLGEWLLVWGVALVALAKAELPDTPMLRLEGGMHSATIWRASADAAGTLLATASDDKTVRLWNLATGNPGHVLRLPSDDGSVGKALAVALSPDGRAVVVGGFTGGTQQGEQLLYVFSARHGGLVAAIGEQPTAVNHLTFSPDGRFLAACYAQRRGVRVYRVDLDQGRIELSGADASYGEGGSYWADWSAAPAGDEGGWRLATTSLDGLVRIYRVAEADGGLGRGKLEPVAKASLPSGGLPFACAFRPGGELLAVGNLKAPRVSVLRSSDLTSAFEPDGEGMAEGDLSKVAWSRDGERLLAAGSYQIQNQENPVLVWNLGGRGSRSSWPAGRQTVMQLLPLEGGRTVVATGDPLWLVLDAEGKRVPSPDGYGWLERRSAQADFSGAFQGRFHLSRDGAKLEIGTVQGGLEPVWLDLRDLSPRPAGASPAMGLLPPSLEAPGLRLSVEGEGARLNGQLLPHEPNEIPRSGAVAADGRFCAVGSSFYLRGYDKDRRPLWKERRMPGEVWAVNISGDGRFVVAACSDGTLRWHRMTDGAPLLSFYLHWSRKAGEMAWICWSPEGYYQSSSGLGEELLGWQVNHGASQPPDFYSAKQLKRVFEDRHGLVFPLVIDTGETASEVVEALVTEKKMQPRPTLATALRGVPIVEMDGAERLSGQIVTEPSVRVTVVAKPSEPGVAVNGSSLTLLVQGRPLPPDLGGEPWEEAGGIWKRSWDVPLAPGPNELVAEARSENDTKAFPARVTVRYRGNQTERGELWILGIGVDTYENSTYSLPHCVADVQGLTEAILRGAQGVFRGQPHVLTPLLNDAATPKQILAALDELVQKTKPEDAVALIYAGHGALLRSHTEGVEPDYYFVLSRVSQMTDSGDLARNGLNFGQIAEAMRRIKAQRQVIFLDACHSGAAGLDLRSSPREMALRTFHEGTGTWLLASSGAEESARGHKSLGHGFFSYAVAEGIRDGKAAGGDQLITLAELRDYVRERVKWLSLEHLGVSQAPHFFGPTNTDFVLGWAGE